METMAMTIQTLPDSDCPKKQARIRERSDKEAAETKNYLKAIALELFVFSQVFSSLQAKKARFLSRTSLPRPV
jgi:hypothetical protein